MGRQPVSIVMATYNGEQFIGEQLESIVSQMIPEDELIISDDGSTDTTVNIVSEYSLKHPLSNLILIDGPKSGVIANFNNAIKHSNNDIVFFSDQDDIWLPGKISHVVEAFSEHPGFMLVTHDALIQRKSMDLDKMTIFEQRRARNGFLRNIVVSTYFGCCMAVKRSMLVDLSSEMLCSPAYDQFISLIAELGGTSFLLKEPLIIRREHGDNMSQRLPLVNKLRFRISLLATVRRYLRRKREVQRVV